MTDEGVRRNALKNVLVWIPKSVYKYTIVAPTNYGKSFLFNPVKFISKAFVNPLTVGIPG